MIIALVGAGGKTTLGRKIAYELSCRGCRLLFTTTTKIARPEDGNVYIGPIQNIPKSSLFTTAAKAVLENGKLQGYPPLELDQTPPIFDHIVVEADGANRKPVKAPNATEPVYPNDTRIVIGVIGLDCLGKPVIDEFVHRPACFADVTQAKQGDIITPGHLLRLISHPHGLFKGAPLNASRIVFLNKYDTIDDTNRDEAAAIIENASLPVFVTSRETDWFPEFYETFMKEAYDG